ncbi:MAG: hypothetical protein R6X19_08030 [Kiritimatiellia bacterium]
MIILGDRPFDRDAGGRLKSRIATVFLRTPGLVTLPGIHATQRAAWAHALNAGRAAEGRPALDPAEQEAEWNESVDLIIEPDAILIRPDPEAMGLSFRADELLQELVSKRRIRFLYATNPQVRNALRDRGEYWRMSGLPRTAEEMRAMLESSRLSIGGGVIYYYNRLTGTRYITLSAFRGLGGLGFGELLLHLLEIQTHSRRLNRFGSPEIDFFLAGVAFGAADFERYDFGALAPEALRAAHGDLTLRFERAVPPSLREDDPADMEWRNRMFSVLLGRRDEAISDDLLRGLSPEFFMQVEWLPGGRIEEGELIFDSVFDELDREPDNAVLRRLCDLRARAFIFNYIREYGDIEHVNIGRISRSLSHRVNDGQARHTVYIAQVKDPERAEPVVHILRVQKWGVPEHLDAGKEFFAAVMESDEYVDYVLDRRLGCRQLGMNLPPRVVTRRIQERYTGPARRYAGATYWLTCFERDYIDGRATDKLPPAAYRDPVFAGRLAVLLGEAAAPNLIVGCAGRSGVPIFDDGDEIACFDAEGRLLRLAVSDHTGAFTDFTSSFDRLAPAYAEPIRRRAALVGDPDAFTEAFLDGFTRRFAHIREGYRRHRRAFRALFRYRPRDEKGSFACRWDRVLDRLETADPGAVAAIIRDHAGGAPCVSERDMKTKG